MLIQVEKLQKLKDALINITEDEKITNLLILFIDEILELSKDKQNNLDSIEVALRCKSAIEFVGHENSKHLSKFMKFLVSVESKEIKESIIGVAEAIGRAYKNE